MLEPRGPAWCTQFGTVKAALHRAFGLLLSTLEQRLCVLLLEAMACKSVELLPDWERDYGLPDLCQAAIYPTSLAARQALVCAARRGEGVQTLAQLQTLLRTVLDCPDLTLDLTQTHAWAGGTAGTPLQVSGGVHVVVPEGRPCPAWFHSTAGGWTGGAGQPLTQGDAQWQLMACLLRKYLPAHIAWTGSDR